ncbi:SMI1/KNR4 family protein [Paenibacillus sp. 22594]|uniref:SMI1/KNR4 family protein n=1 Tax=Paenibacillus sp. 22594 TaxID=3453947 RepID=UPI003F875A0C
MSYDFIKRNSFNTFYPVTENEISNMEKALNLRIPNELKKLFLEVGYGFIKGSENNVNRIMDPYSIRDFRLRENDYKYYPDIEIYDEFEVNKLIFFEGNETALMSIDLNESINNPIYYYDTQIADSLKDFLVEIEKDDKYYLEFVD